MNMLIAMYFALNKRLIVGAVPGGSAKIIVILRYWLYHVFFGPVLFLEHFTYTMKYE
jgi:hypothetical protein